MTLARIDQQYRSQRNNTYLLDRLTPGEDVINCQEKDSAVLQIHIEAGRQSYLTDLFHGTCTLIRPTSI